MEMVLTTLVQLESDSCTMSFCIPGWSPGCVSCSYDPRQHSLIMTRLSRRQLVTCASIAPTPQHRMLSGRCSVSAIPRRVFCANVSILFPAPSPNFVELVAITCLAGHGSITKGAAPLRQ